MSKESKLLELYIDSVLGKETVQKIGSDFYIGKVVISKRYDDTLEAKWLVSTDEGYEEIPNVGPLALNSMYVRIDRWYNDKRNKRLQEFYRLEETIDAQKQA